MGSLIEVRRRILTQTPHLETASGTLVNFSSPSAMPLKKLQVDIAPVQIGSGDPSPENIRPISGWTGINAYHESELLSFSNYLPGTYENLGAIWTVNTDGTFTVNGTPYSYSSASYGDISVNGDEILYGKIIGTANNVAFNKPQLFDANGNAISFSAADNVLFYGLDLRNYNGVKKVRVMLKRNINDVNMHGVGRVVVKVNSAPNSITYPISWQSEAGEIYGGYVDLVNGELVVNRGFVTLDGNAIKFSGMYTDATRYRAYTSANGIPGLIYGSGKDAKPIASNMLGKPNGTTTNLDYAPPFICAGSYNAQFYVALPLSLGFSTVADANTWLSANPIQVSYLLTNEQRYQLFPQQIKTLCDTNNIFSDAGITTVKYWTH